MNIREATKEDFDSIWPIFHEIVSAGETYSINPNITKKAAIHLWIEYPQKTYIYLENDQILGTYYLKKNMDGPGSHVCNCGYMVYSVARGRGLASEMCKHSQKIAKQLGYKAMQFNSVVSTNEGAVRLWQKLGFEIVGTVPKAFHHPEYGFVDTHVMYKKLVE